MEAKWFRYAPATESTAEPTKRSPSKPEFVRRWQERLARSVGSLHARME